MRVLKSFRAKLPAHAIRFSLCDREPEVVRALLEHFRDADGVEILEGDILQLDCQAIVSPSNSFGYMDGGLDQAIDCYYEGRAQRLVLDEIANRFFGELPVGSALILPMATRRLPFLVVAPTMRVPGDIQGTIYPYLAMRAACIAILEQHRNASDPIRSVAVPGLGTGVGGMPPDEAARQMRAGYDMIIQGHWKRIQHPLQAPFVLARAR